MKWFSGLITFLMFLSVAFADIIELHNGRTIEGTFVGRDGENIKFDVDGIGMTFNAADVKNISMGSSKPSSSSQKGVIASDSKQEMQKTTIPAGTYLLIRIVETLSSSRHQTGYKFTAKLESAIVIDGKIVIPVNSNVYGVVLASKQSRRVAGNSTLDIAVTDVRINGQLYGIKTTGLTAVSENTAKKSAGQVGRWAAVGAIADGKSGARTGAKVGAGTAILSGGNQTQIPAGTLLEFGLKESVTL